MTKITYTYEIVAVDGAARCMEIVYSSPGRQTYHIGARLPYDGETTEGIVRMYAPVANWREADIGVSLPQVGASGEIQDGVNPDDPVDPDELLSTYMTAVNGYVEMVALRRQYSSAAHLATYVTSTNPDWAAEAVAFISWCDSVWLTAMSALNSAQEKGEAPEELYLFIASLPTINWP
jgi:hypothetical protein